MPDAEIAFQVGQPRKTWMDLPLFEKIAALQGLPTWNLGTIGHIQFSEATSDGWTSVAEDGWAAVMRSEANTLSHSFIVAVVKWSRVDHDLIYFCDFTIPIHPVQPLHPRGGPCSAALGFPKEGWHSSKAGRGKSWCPPPLHTEGKTERSSFLSIFSLN